MTEEVGDDHIDDTVDEQIRQCLNLDKPQSFFLFAGAGSGKTRSLVSAIDHLRSADDVSLNNRHWLQVRGKRVAVITFTNAARDEIIDRTKQDPLVVVHTIHSFAWLLIQKHQNDIREWLKGDLEESISELTEAQGKRKRTDTKVYADTQRSIVSKTERLKRLDEIPEFIYSPTGDNVSKDSLSHGEVIKIVSDFLSNKETMQQILVDAFPVLLIDESQDTNRHLLEALVAVQEQHSEAFCLGLFGDTMQRIYADGHPSLGKEGFVPESWARPAKVMNHRSQKRIVDLINRIRSEVDGQTQQWRQNNTGGQVRIFVIDRTKLSDPLSVEMKIRQKMSEVTGDENWSPESQDADKSVKTLILEHHMAAKRLDFDEFFAPLYRVGSDTFRTNLLSGQLSPARFFCSDVAELVDAIGKQDKFAIARIVQDKSPLIDHHSLLEAGERQVEALEEARAAIEKLQQLLGDNSDPTLIELLEIIGATRLLTIPSALIPFAGGEKSEVDSQDDVELEDVKSEIAAWRSALQAPLSQARKYFEYVTGETGFDTHQGVKGLEFPRVMVVINDEEARGFLFSFDKLFGAKEKSARDAEHEAAGTDSAVDRTRRLFYVTASRAMEGLALAAYTDDPIAVEATVIDSGLFLQDEVEVYQ